MCGNRNRLRAKKNPKQEGKPTKELFTICRPGKLVIDVSVISLE
jgi:hypothetical protein